MSRRMFPILFIAMLSVTANALADAESAKATATSLCAGCHGPQGISAVDAYPNLAGQKKAYLASALKAYREKTRTNGMMNAMASSLKDQDIDDLAAYFSGLTPGH
jgi:cytochrome c553